MQDFAHGMTVPIVYATLIVYPILASMNLKILNFNGLALMTSLIMLLVGFVAVTWLFNKVDDANERKYYPHRLDGAMRLFRSVHAAFFLFVIYRAFLCAYLNINVDTLFAEKYLLIKLGSPYSTLPAFDYSHTISVFKNLAIWFPALSAVGYLALNVARRFTR